MANNQRDRRGLTSLAAIALALAVLLASSTACERTSEASRASLARRRNSWAGELAGLKEQQAALAARLDGRMASAAGSVAQRRMWATLDGARQAIADTELELQQAESRIEHAIERGSAVGQKSMEDESSKARSYLQALGEQIATAARQIDEFAQNESETKHTTP